jgi:hypothetical protein
MDYEDTILSSNSPSFGSQDSGFDSVLDLNDNDSISSNTSSPLQNFLFKTPTKYSRMSNITPIKLNRSSLKADLNSIYYSSIKNHQQQSPISKTQHNYSAYISEYDTQTSCLLRSPIIQQSPCSPSYCVTPKRTSQLVHVTQKIKCKPFISLKKSQSQQTLDEKQSKNVQEFLQNIFNNHYLNANSQIGFKMGIEYVDILSELVQRSMHHIVDSILVKCKPKDYASFYAVSKSWKSIIGNDSRCNKVRLKYLKHRNRYLNVTKENKMLVSKRASLNGKQRLQQETSGCFTPIDTNRLISTSFMTKLELPMRKSPIKKSPLKLLVNNTSKHTISPIKFYAQSLPIEKKISCLSLLNKSPSKNICSKINKKNLKRL